MHRVNCGAKAFWEQFDMGGKILLVEGSENTRYPTGWRRGFEKLLRNAGIKYPPGIIPSHGRDKAIDDFKKNKKPTDLVYLLVDLDGPSYTREAFLVQKGLEKQAHLIFFSIQEIEAWFLSQPSVLDTSVQL
jgi:hypothetical protein